MPAAGHSPFSDVCFKVDGLSPEPYTPNPKLALNSFSPKPYTPQALNPTLLRP